MSYKKNSYGKWEHYPGMHACKAALQPPPICVEGPVQPTPTIIFNICGQNQLNLSAPPPPPRKEAGNTLSCVG